MASEPSAFATMMRYLRKLKTELMRDNINAQVSSPSGSNVGLLIPGVPDEVTCRTNPADEHTWWYWQGQTPLAAAREPGRAVAAIKQAQTGRR